jgi:hypothetical protein
MAEAVPFQSPSPARSKPLTPDYSPRICMIARIWHGYTKPEHADAYEAMLKPEILPGISKAKG